MTYLNCDIALINRYLDGSASPADQVELETHLCDCENCQSLMYAKAALPEFWEQLQTNLDTSEDVEIRSSYVTLHNSQRTEIQGNTKLAYERLLQNYLEPVHDKNSDAIGRMDDYEILGLIGQGGMGLVLKAYDKKLKRFVAIKTMLSDSSFGARNRERLLREAQAAASIRHKHIVPVFAIESWKDLPLIVMPYIQHGTLQTYAEKHTLDVGDVLNVGIQVCEALAEAHCNGIVHRDVKPSNILLQDGIKHVLLSDFGLARSDGDQTLTMTGEVAGTPQFMSPEQAQGKPLDHRTDLFSFGSLLYWLCTKRSPFTAGTSYGTILKIVSERHRSAQEINPGVPAWLSQLIDGLLIKDPHSRLGDAKHVLQLLKDCYAYWLKPDEHELPSELRFRNFKNATWHRGTFASLAIVAVVALTCSIVFLQSGRGEPRRASENEQAVTKSVRYFKNGPLNHHEQLRMMEELQDGENEEYWLHRMAYLPVMDIPAESIPIVIELANHSDPLLREYATAILNKDPFQVIASAAPSDMQNQQVSTGALSGERPSETPVNETQDNPFVEIHFLNSTDK